MVPGPKEHSQPPQKKKKYSFLFKFLSMLSVVRGYNIAVIVLAQYLALHDRAQPLHQEAPAPQVGADGGLPGGRGGSPGTGDSAAGGEGRGYASDYYRH